MGPKLLAHRLKAHRDDDAGHGMRSSSSPARKVRIAGVPHRQSHEFERRV